MKDTTSLEKDIINIKGEGKRVIIPLDPIEGIPWDELI